MGEERSGPAFLFYAGAMLCIVLVLAVTTGATSSPLPPITEQHIAILNPQSYPRVGGNWTIYFSTNGSGTLEINDHSFPEEVGFAALYRKVGDAWVEVPVVIEGDVIRADWRYTEGKMVFGVKTAGKHTLEFRFGNVAYAKNMAKVNDAMVVYQDAGASSTPTYRLWNTSDWNASGISGTAVTGTIYWATLHSCPTRDEKILLTLSSSQQRDAHIWNGTCWHDGTGTCNTKKNWASNVYSPSYMGQDVAYEQLSGDAVLVYHDETDGWVKPAYVTWNGNYWGEEGLTIQPAAGFGNWFRLVSIPNSNDILMVTTDTNSALRAQYWNGSGWNDNTVLGTSTSSRQGFDAAAEQKSGDVLVCWRDDGETNVPKCRMFYTNHTWGSQFSANSIGAGHEAYYVKMAADPDSNNITIAVSDSDDDLEVQMWDGDSDSLSANIQLDGTIGDTITYRRNFDLAYEKGTSQLVVVYDDAGAGDGAYQTWNASEGWSGANSLPTDAGLDPNFYWMQLTPDLYSSEMFLTIMDSNNDEWIERWRGTDPLRSDGTGWTGLTQLDTASSGLYESFMVAYDLHSGLTATLDNPTNYSTDPFQVAQNSTLEVNATVTCNLNFCGEVKGTLLNGTTNTSNATGDVPLHIISGEPTTKSCTGNPLTSGESCTLGWVVNATGDVRTNHTISVLFTSNRSGPDMGAYTRQTEKGHVMIVKPWLTVTLDSPLGGNWWAQNATYGINATATAHGLVNGVTAIPLNDSTPMSDTAGDRPFYNLSANVDCGNLADGETCSVGWVVNATGETDYYNISARFYSSNADTVDTPNATVEIVPPYVRLVSFSSPTNGTMTAQNYTFEVNVSVISHGHTGDVWGILQNSSYPEGGAITNMSNMTGDSPFYILNGEPNPKYCSGNPLTNEETCELGWLVNATGDEDYYNLRVLFESSRSVANGTNTSNVTVQIVKPFLNVTLNSPSSGSVVKGRNFTINATVVAFGDVGNVHARPRNGSTNMSNASGDTPFYIAGGDAIKSCANNPLLHTQTCELTWTAHVSSGELTTHDIEVYFESDVAGIEAAATGNATVTIYYENYTKKKLYNATVAENAIGARTCTQAACHIADNQTWPQQYSDRNDDEWPWTGATWTYNNTPGNPDRIIYAEHPGGRGPATLNPSFVHTFHDKFPQWTVAGSSQPTTVYTTGDEDDANEDTIPSWTAGDTLSERNMAEHYYSASYSNEGRDNEPGNPQGGAIVARRYDEWYYCALSCHNTDGSSSGIDATNHGWKAGDGYLTACTDCHSGADTNFNHGDASSACYANCHETSPNDVINGEPDCATCHQYLGDAGTDIAMDSVHAGKLCEDCHGHGHDVSVPQCTECHPRTLNTGHTTEDCKGCHNTTGDMAHNTSIDLCTDCHTTTSSDSGKRSRRPVPPMWDTENANYHGNLSRGTKGGRKCVECHPSDYHDPSVKTCQDAACHGSGGDGPYIIESHSTLECQECHNNATMDSQSGSQKDLRTNIHSSFSNQLIPFNITTTVLTSADCKQCHDTFGTDSCTRCHGDEIHNATMNVSTTLDGEHEGGPNCRNCHYAELNLTSFDSGNAIHKNINTTVETGYENVEPCWACHGNGTQPPSSFGHNSWNSRVKDPWNCTDCHLPGKGNYSAPIVYEHVSTSDVTVADSCESCHNRSVIASDDTNIPNSRANVSHYGKTTGLKVGSSATSTKDCIGCHKESVAQSNKWRAGRLYLPNTSHSKTLNTANGCWSCHLTTKAAPANDFHDAELKRPTWSCPECHY